MQKVMEQPEVKAKMEETRKEQSQLRDREYAMVFKALDRGQVSLFRKMLGKPFDVDSVMGGFFGGGPGGRRNGANGNANQATATAKAATGKTAPRRAPLPMQLQAPSRPRLLDGPACGNVEPWGGSSQHQIADRLTEPQYPIR